MKTVGIITIHNSPSYGGSLQSYALWKYIHDLGYDCEIIDLYRPYQKEYIPSKRFKKQPQNITWKTKIKGIIKNILKRKKEIKYYSESAKNKFSEFNKQIKYSRPYLSLDDLYDNPPIYDLYITGSDQVWNPYQPYLMEPYFLTFAPVKSAKISFAASIGVTELPTQYKQDFKKWLTSYRTICVREKQAKKLLENFIDKPINVVCDPTILIDTVIWKSISIEPTIKQPYILLFTLDYNPTLINYCLNLSQESNLKLVVLGMIQPDSPNYTTVKDAGPREFIGYIEHAEMVITDSFHGTVFSLIMGTKNFYTYINPENKKSSRITDLLEIFHLKDHLLCPNLSNSYKDLVKNTLNHSTILEILTQEQKKSQHILIKELQS